MALDEAIAKATKVYEKERRHAAPTEVIAQDIGYKGANNGAALAALASLRYFGLLDRPKEGHLAASKDLETYLYAPNDDVKASILKKWMTSPPVFQEILEKYEGGLPSDATLRFDLINQGFTPQAAESLISVFKRSADFAGVYAPLPLNGAPVVESVTMNEEVDIQADNRDQPRSPAAATTSAIEDFESDRIPIRLHSGRRAWLVIPSPFYEADKQRLKAHIDLLLTDDV
jgi:hypothetical protein